MKTSNKRLKKNKFDSTLFIWLCCFGFLNLSLKCNDDNIVKSFGIVIVDSNENCVYYPVKSSYQKNVVNWDFNLDSSLFEPGFNLGNPLGNVKRPDHSSLVKLRDESCNEPVDSVCYYKVGWLEVKHIKEDFVLDSKRYPTYYKFNKHELNLNIIRINPWIISIDPL